MRSLAPRYPTPDEWEAARHELNALHDETERRRRERERDEDRGAREHAAWYDTSSELT